MNSLEPSYSHLVTTVLYFSLITLACLAWSHLCTAINCICHCFPHISKGLVQMIISSCSHVADNYQARKSQGWTGIINARWPVQACIVLIRMDYVVSQWNSSIPKTTHASCHSISHHMHNRPGEVKRACECFLFQVRFKCHAEPCNVGTSAFDVKISYDRKI